MNCLTTSRLVALSLCGLATTSHAQQLRAVGVTGSFHVARLITKQAAFTFNSVTIDPQADQSNDETGKGITLFGRWQLGPAGWYVQPELGYLSALETPVLVSGVRSSIPYANSRIRRLDVRVLGGHQVGPWRLFAGPSLGYHLFNRFSDSEDLIADDPELQAAYAALDVRPARVQLALQVGTGVTLGRFDLNARYEWGLSPYKRVSDRPSQSLPFTRHLQQLVLEAGFQLYKRPTP